jgi:mono/diheme cytochrome c family protein
MLRHNSSRSDRMVHVALAIVASLLLAPVVGVAWAQNVEEAPALAASATEGDSGDGTVSGAAAEQLRLGAQVYSEKCSACHQPGGAGIAGQFPPLIGNPHAQDADYLVQVIEMGLEGRIEVLGSTYDGRMPAFSTIPADEVEALVLYIQAGLTVPALPAPVDGVIQADGGSTAYLYWVALAVMAVTALVFAPRLVSSNDRLAMSWFDAGLKTMVIVVGFIIFTVFVPNWAMQTDTVAGLDSTAQDLIGSGLWLGGLAAGLFALWYAHRRDHI